MLPTPTLRMYEVAAFTAKGLRGNPAAVVLGAEHISEESMQLIAAENNLSETAFLLHSRSSESDFQLRWFTPKHEVELCGHATLATAWVLFQQRGWHRPDVRFQTHSGILKAVAEGDKVTIDLPARDSESAACPSALIEGLGCTPEHVRQGANWIAVLSSEEQLRRLRPDFTALASLHPHIVVVTAPGDESDMVSRCFAPSYGIEEDPVTGSAHCDLAPYWSERLGRTTMSARQLSERGGELRIRLEPQNRRTYLSGQCRLFLEGEIIPPQTTAS